VLDLPQAAHEIASSAVARLRTGPSRRCKLRKGEIVIRVLVVLRAGFSQAAAARAAGVSEAALRLC
jgi:hypothetical protein